MRVFAVAIAVLGATPALAEAETVPGPVLMKPSEIKAYNAALDPRDPAYIVCTKTAPTGSLVTRRDCRTRAEWDRHAAIGNDNARALVTDAQTRQFGVNQEPAGTVFPAVGN